MDREYDSLALVAPVIALVLFAAVLHATWNAIVKQSGERMLTFAVVIGMGAVMYLPVAFFVPPPSAASWPFLAGSATVHLFYYAALLSGYRFGDLGQVYPIARGTGPLIVGLLSWPLAGERLGVWGGLGVALVSVGILALSGRGGEHAKKSVAFAVATGFCIGAYTLCDGFGVRAAGSKLGYLAWLHLATGIPFATFALVLRRRVLGRFLRAYGRRAVLGGVVATVAYSIAVFAMSLTTLAYVASLRETSVILAAVIGTLFLGEPFGRRRIVAAVLVAAGIVLLSAGG